MSAISSLIPDINTILGARDDVGAALKEVYIVTRTWTGEEPGDGDSMEEKTRVLPSPRVVQYAHDMRLREGGFIKQGDLILKMLSKATFPLESDVNCRTNSKRIEKFYEIGGDLYEVISVTEKHLTWNVQVRRLSAQR